MKLIYKFIICLCIVILGTATAFSATIESEFGAGETKMGEEASVQIAKDFKLSKNEDDLKKLREMGDKMAAIANKTEIKSIYGSSQITPFKYTFNIIEEKDINAFSVPGGFIYMYRGLMDFVQSDQELAGVMAHEIIHAAHHHMVFQLRKQAAMQNQMALVVLAAMLGKSRSSDLSNIMLGVQLYQIAQLNGYGMQAERDSDYAAILLMKESGYNPVGLLTFMERLAQRPELFNYGIYRSHPMDGDRVKAAKNLMAELNIPIKRRETTKAIIATVTNDKADNTGNPQVELLGEVIYKPSSKIGISAEEIAKCTADKINEALDAQISMYDIKSDPANGILTLKNKPVMLITEEDAKLMNKTPDQIVASAAYLIRSVLTKQMLETVH